MTDGAAAREAAQTSRDVAVAIRSAVTLGGSLIATWSVALLVRLVLPRHLGPELFGAYNLADSFAAACFVLLGLGVETYVQKEIPLRPAHASDFLAGIILVRLVMSAGIFAAMALAMHLAGRTGDVQRAVYVFGVAQILIAQNATLAALLQASSAVGGLAIINVGAKLLWGAAIVVALATGTGLGGLAVAFLSSEVLRAVVLFSLVRKHLGVRLEIAPRAIKQVVLSSLPFYVNSVAVVFYAKADVSLMSVLANDVEVGWYSTAANFAGLALMISPLIGWVLLPLMARTAARSRDDLMALVRRAIEVILTITIPVSLIMSLGADLWIELIFGKAFLPAIPALRILGPMFLITYLAMIGATCNNLLGRGWAVTVISLTGLVLNVVANILVVPYALRRLGPGGAGIGASFALVGTEIVVTIAFFALLGKDTFDRRSLMVIAKSGAVCVVVACVDHAIHGWGFARMGVCVVVYTLLVLATGAVRPREVREMVRATLRMRRQPLGE